MTHWNLNSIFCHSHRQTYPHQEVSSGVRSGDFADQTGEPNH